MVSVPRLIKETLRLFGACGHCVATGLAQGFMAELIGVKVSSC